MKLSGYKKLLMRDLINDKVWHFDECSDNDQRRLRDLSETGLVEISDHNNPICTPTQAGEDSI